MLAMLSLRGLALTYMIINTCAAAYIHAKNMVMSNIPSIFGSVKLLTHTLT